MTGEDHWAAIWAHREALLRVAMRRLRDSDDAEDVVAEAMARALEDRRIDAERLGAWLTTVTVRLCVDLERDRRRWRAREAYTRRMEGRPPTPEDEVLARQRAAEIRHRLDQRPARQRRAVELRSEGRSVREIAADMGVSYKVAEGLLDRARAALRRLLSRAALPALHRLRPGRPGRPWTILPAPA